VLQRAGFVLREDDDLPSVLGEAFEHEASLAAAATRRP
jgi:hypothetical protein